MYSTAIAGIQAIGGLSLNPGRHTPLLNAGIGFALGLVVFSVVSPLLPVYVLGHEMSHWVVAKVFRRRTAGLNIGKEGGSLMVERTNVWITLAPYFVPFYTVAWLILCAIARIWLHQDWMETLLFSGVGFTYAYHLVTTAIALLHGQSDLRVHGPVLSFALLLMMNCMLLFWGLAMFNHSFRRAPRCLRDAYRSQYRFAYGVERIIRKSVRW